MKVDYESAALSIRCERFAGSIGLLAGFVWLLCRFRCERLVLSLSNHRDGTGHSSIHNIVLHILITLISKELFVRVQIILLPEVGSKQLDKLHGSLAGPF